MRNAPTVLRAGSIRMNNMEGKSLAALGHLALGFAAKPLAPQVSLGVSLVATEVLDILWAGFSVTGIDPGVNGASPLSHGLFMSVAWSVATAFTIGFIYRNRRSGVIVGLLVFSHWVLDFITHPMGTVFGGNPSPQLAMAADLGMLILGIALYVMNVVKIRRATKNNGSVLGFSLNQRFNFGGGEICFRA